MFGRRLAATAATLSLLSVSYHSDAQQTTLPPERKERTEQEAKDTVSVSVLFSGPAIDTHLTAFYAYLAKNRPELLKPVPIDPTSYRTVSEAALGSGVLFRYYPVEFTTEVHKPLSDWAKYKAVPGLKPVPYEHPAVVKKDEAEKTTGELCQKFRIDDKPCAVKPFGDYLYLRGQGVRVTLDLPRGDSGGVIKDIQTALKAHPGYATDVKLYVGSRMLEQNIPGAGLGPVQFTEIKNGECTENDSTGLRKRVMDYYEAVRYYTPPQLNGVTQVLVLDRFPQAKASRIYYEPEHVNFQDSARPYVPCLAKEPVDNRGHGLHVAGVIGAKPNGSGIVGVAPAAALRLLPPAGKEIEVDDLVQAMELAQANEIVILHGSFANPKSHDRSEGSLYDILRKHFENSILDRLYVFSAGNDGTRLTEQNCTALPPCLGNLPNVIVVAALDEDPLMHSRLLRLSNYGAPMVSLAAPGTGILSTDLDDRYTIRDGTSVAAPFVTGAAALISQVAPHLEPYKIKQRLVATARFDLSYERSEDVVGGILDITAAVTNISEDVVIIEEPDERLVGSINPKLAAGKLLLYDRGLYGPGENAEYVCPADKLLRIHRRSDRFTVVCMAEYRPHKKIGVTVWHNKILKPRGGGMACLEQGDCLTIKYRGANGQERERTIDLFKVKDIYFGFKP